MRNTLLTDDILHIEQHSQEAGGRRYIATHERDERGRRVNYQYVIAGGTPSEPSLVKAEKVGSGLIVGFRVARCRFSMQVKCDGAPKRAVVALEGSINYEDWVVLGTWDSHSQKTSILAVDGPPVVYARATLTVLEPGERKPSVSAVICAV